MRIFTSQAILVLALTSGNVVGGDNPLTSPRARELLAKPILESHVIAHTTTQLRKDADLAGYEDIEYVQEFADCRKEVRKQIDSWIFELNITPSSQYQHNTRVRIVVTIDKPIDGDIIILYRVYTEHKKAYLEILFDGNKRLNPSERQTLVEKYKLIRLKKKLIKSMKCPKA